MLKEREIEPLDEERETSTDLVQWNCGSNPWLEGTEVSPKRRQPKKEVVAVAQIAA
jgi:hypothetical protein